jgi:hypothetical protein
LEKAARRFGPKLGRLEEINLPFPVDIYAYVWFLAERLDAFGTKV